MSPLPPACAGNEHDRGSDKLIIQTFESDHETRDLRLTATIVTSMDELRARAAAGAFAAPGR
jgi:hypothetical protein